MEEDQKQLGPQPPPGFYHTKEYLSAIRKYRFKADSKAAIKKKNKPKRKVYRKRHDSELRARDLLKFKVRDWMIAKSTYMDGVASIPVFHRIAFELDFSLTQLSLFVLMNHYRWVTRSDAEVWGYEPEVLYQYLRKFRALGLVETFTEKGKNRYVVSVKGRELFSTFQDKYHEGIKSFHVEYGKENPLRHFRPRAPKTKKDKTDNGTANPVTTSNC